MSYLMAGQASELDRLRLQSLVWEPAGRRLLDEVGAGAGVRALDVGCGCLGWLRVLSEWVGPRGRVTGTDVAADMLGLARDLVHDERLSNVEVVADDVFDSRLPEAAFDLVHARFQLAPLGRADEQVATLRRLVAPGGVIVLEDPDTSSWTWTPQAPALAELVSLIRAAFHAGGGDFDAGRREYELLVDAGLDPQLRAEVVALPPGHPYLRLPVQFAASLRPRLLDLVDDVALDRLLEAAEGELAQPGRRGLTFTLVQTWARV